MIDQIVLEDMLPENTKVLKNQPIDEDKAGLGQHYCIPCVRYFPTDAAMKEHEKGKEHKKRRKITLTEVPYTIEEAERAGGLYQKPKANPYVPPGLAAK